jgi:DNA-binding NtrC family response regulator
MKTEQEIYFDEDSLRRVLLDDNDPLLRRILVVDNDPSVRMNCRVILHGKESVVFAAENIDEAFEKMSMAEFDLIMTDIMLPDVHQGLAFVKKALKMQPWADVVVT